MSNKVIPLRTGPQKTTRTSTDTISFSLEEMKRWNKPEFQREIKKTRRYYDAVETIKASGGVIPGVMTLGILEGTKDIYKIDGNHRTEAAKESGCETFFADVRYVYGSMEDFADEYSRLNEQISATKPDDRLRAAAVSNPRVNRLLALCKVVGFAKRNQPKLKISMSSILRAWNNASRSTPAARGKAASAIDIIRDISDEDFGHLCALLNHCEAAWGRDFEYASLWGQMNLTTVMWLYVQLVTTDPASPKIKRLSKEIFEKCLMSLSAEERYVTWLKGRNGGTHRGPCYMRVKEKFAKRIYEETGSKPNLPQPEWASR